MESYLIKNQEGGSSMKKRRREGACSSAHDENILISVSKDIIYWDGELPCIYVTLYLCHHHHLLIFFKANIEYVAEDDTVVIALQPHGGQITNRQKFVTLSSLVEVLN